MHILDAVERTAELEARLAAAEQELGEWKARYDELRHRIKNDLQALCTNLCLQARLADQGDRCGHCVSRLRSAAAAYQMFDATDGGLVSMAEYLSVLSQALLKLFGDRIMIVFHVEPGIQLDQRRAQRVGMICAEAAMNAAKHAFPCDGSGNIDVRFKRLGEGFEMTVADDGVGFDPAAAQRGQGLDLMEQFARQLKGGLVFDKSPIGTIVRLTFAAVA
jgi:two-component sensor histidine kinase